MTIYEEMLAALSTDEIASWLSTLYVKATTASTEIISRYEFKSMVTTFIDQITLAKTRREVEIDGVPLVYKGDKVKWYEIPFAYDPFWREMEVKCLARASRQ